MEIIDRLIMMSLGVNGYAVGLASYYLLCADFRVGLQKVSNVILGI